LSAAGSKAIKGASRWLAAQIGELLKAIVKAVRMMAERGNNLFLLSSGIVGSLRFGQVRSPVASSARTHAA
jgi:hypothetical protein